MSKLLEESWEMSHEPLDLGLAFMFDSYRKGVEDIADVLNSLGIESPHTRRFIDDSEIEQ